jgi:hypothetical protein
MEEFCLLGMAWFALRRVAIMRSYIAGHTNEEMGAVDSVVLQKGRVCVLTAGVACILPLFSLNGELGPLRIDKLPKDNQK